MLHRGLGRAVIGFNAPIGMDYQCPLANRVDHGGPQWPAKLARTLCHVRAAGGAGIVKGLGGGGWVSAAGGGVGASVVVAGGLGAGPVSSRGLSGHVVLLHRSVTPTSARNGTGSVGEPLA